MKKKLLAGLSVGMIMFGVTGVASATVIGFEDLTTRNNFNALSIVDTYQGYEWGYGTSSGVPGRTFSNVSTGWASATVGDTAVDPAPAGMGGSSYAWNWNGPQSLWIDFRTATDFTRADFAVLSPSYSLNASTIQLFGYDANDILVGSSAILSLTDTFQDLTANFSGINYLEIRANSYNTWFSVDNLTVNENSAPVPEPATMLLFGTGIAGLAGSRIRRKKK